MNRKIFFSGLSIIAAVTLTAGSAFAAFTTKATATGNTFSTDTPSLSIQVNNGATGQSEPGANVSGLIPGVAGPAQTFVVTNNDLTNNIPVTLQLTASATNTLPGTDLSIEVTCPATSVDVTDTYSGWISTGHSLGTVNANGGTLSCTMTPTLSSGIGNSDIGLSAIFDAAFIGTLGN